MHVTESVPATTLLPELGDFRVEQLAILNVLKIVGYPDEVKVSISRGRKSVMIEFEVNDSDRGRVIGKNGHTIGAIRSLVGAAAGASDVNYIIHVLENGESASNGRRR